MRIVAGKFKGASLEAPKGLSTRPTSDRVRQALFNVLEHGPARFEFEGARVLDLFAGTGALALEALSRGARYAVLIEEDAAARAAIRRNVEALSLTGVTKIWRRDATRLGEPERFSPSTSSSATRLMARASANGLWPRPPPGVGWPKAPLPCLRSGPLTRSRGPRPSRKSTGAATAIP